MRTLAKGKKKEKKKERKKYQTTWMAWLMAQIRFAATQDNRAAAQLWPLSSSQSPKLEGLNRRTFQPKVALGLCCCEFPLEIVSAGQ